MFLINVVVVVVKISHMFSENSIHIRICSMESTFYFFYNCHYLISTFILCNDIILVHVLSLFILDTSNIEYVGPV